MTGNRFGYRVELDRADRLFYIVDAHGSTIHGPHPSHAEAEQWIAEWVERMDRLRDLVRQQDEARRAQPEARSA